MSNLKYHGQSLEQQFLLDYLKEIERSRNSEAQILINGAFEDLAQARERVGYIRACNDLRNEFERLLKAYFPST